MRLFAGTEGFFEHQGEFATAIRHVLLLVAGGRGCVVEGADALLKRKQRLVDLGALHATLAVVALGVCSAL